MSNFNVTAPNAAGSAISLGGEWTGRDQMEANKYKSTIFQHMRQRGKQKKTKSDRPKTTPGAKQLYSADTDNSSKVSPPKSAPPGSKPRCERFYDVEHRAGRKILEPHLKVRHSPRTSKDETEISREYQLGSGMVMTKSKSKVSVKIDTGLSLDPPPAPRVEVPEVISDGNPESAEKLQQVASFYHRSIQSKSQGIVGKGNFSISSPSQMSTVSSGYIGSLGGISSPYSSPNTGSCRDSPDIAIGASPAATSSSLLEALIVQLQQQVADLSLFLGEERLNHKATKEKATAVMNQKLQELDKKHVERYEKMQEDYEDKIDIMKQVHEKEKEHQKATSDMQLARMKGELEFLQGAFEAYKKTLVQDMEEKWNKKEQDMKIAFQEEMDSNLHQQRTELLEEKSLEKKVMSREFQKQMQNMIKEHKKEVENMMKKFSSASSDVENLRRALDQLKAVREELDQTLEKLALTEEILQDTREELQEANLKILNYQDTFQDKVDEVDDKYKERIHQLMQDNTELRKRYIQKCDELFNEKSNTEFKRVEKVSSTKEILQMIVHAKNRSNVNMAGGDNEIISYLKAPIARPFSAPITKRETKNAFQTAGESEITEDDANSVNEGFYTQNRPQTTALGRRRLNREALMEKSFKNLKGTSLQSL